MLAVTKYKREGNLQMTQKRIALVTGANRGIGLETARQLAAKGIKVLIGARSEEKGLEAESTLRNEGLDVEFVKIDVDDPQRMRPPGSLSRRVTANSTFS